MNANDLKHTINNIVTDADTLKRKFIDIYTPINYACIFCQSDKEYASYINVTEQVGKVIEETDSGPLFQIDPLPTIAGLLQLLKIRKPDTTKPERGDADFTLPDYNGFKKTHLNKDGFKLIHRKNFEMIELMDPDFDIRVYFSNPPLDKQLGIV